MSRLDPPPPLVDTTPGAGDGGARRPAPAVLAPYIDDELTELLATIGCVHWSPVVRQLLQRYAGWRAAHERRLALAPDFEPLASVIEILVRLQQTAPVTDRRLAQALCDCVFLAQLADDPQSGQAWEPLEQSFADFARGRICRAFWGVDLPWPEQQFIDWLLEQLPRPAAA